jgi:3-phytase
LIKAIDFATESSDGSDVTNFHLGSRFPKGLFVAMSEKKVFKYFDWRDIEKAIKEK